MSLSKLGHCYKISWVAKETRPEASGLVSIIASRLAHGTIEDVLLMNKMVTHLRSTAQHPLILWKMNVDTLSFVVVSGAGGVGSLPCDASGADLKVLGWSLPVNNCNMELRGFVCLRFVGNLAN